MSGSYYPVTQRNIPEQRNFENYLMELYETLYYSNATTGLPTIVFSICYRQLHQNGDHTNFDVAETLATQWEGS
jgi:hypothetical protein